MSALVNVFSLKVAKAIGYNTVVLITAVLALAGNLMASYSQSYWLFAFAWVILLNGGIGLSLLPTLSSLWLYFPKSKGLINGILFSGVGLSGFGFTQLGLYIVNPNNLKPELIIDENGKEIRMFYKEVSDKVPSMLLVFGIIFFIVALCSSFLIISPGKEPRSTVDDSLRSSSQSLLSSPEMSKFDVPYYKQKVFWQLYAIAWLGMAPGMFVQFTYKDYGYTKSLDDSFLSGAGSVGFLLNGTLRVSFGFIADRFRYKMPITIIMAIQVLILVMYGYNDNEYLFGLGFAVTMIDGGGSLVLAMFVLTQFMDLKWLAKLCHFIPLSCKPD
jgi:hypothetical protein